MATDLELVRGDTTPLVITVSEAYDANGQPITNLSPYTAVFTARYAPNGDVVFAKSGASIAIAGMVVTVKLAEADTAGLSGGERLVCDLELRDGSGHVATVGPFEVTVVADVTY